MLKLVELPGYERRKPNQISGGQAQRVALARALINRPAVLLLDEPLGALDLKLRKQMQVELKRIQQEVGITFIYVTHDQEEAMTMSDRIAVMNHGRYEQLGDPESLYERPTTRFVAGFLGVSNLLPGDGARRRRRLRERHARPTTRRSGSRGPASTALERRRASVSGPRRSACTELKERAAGLNRLLGGSATPSYIGVSTQYIVETSAGRPVTVYEQNVERATRSELWASGRGRSAHLVSRPHVRHRDRADAAGPAAEEERTDGRGHPRPPARRSSRRRRSSRAARSPVGQRRSWPPAPGPRHAAVSAAGGAGRARRRASPARRPARRRTAAPSPTPSQALDRARSSSRTGPPTST